MSFLKRIFSIDTTSTNRVIICILGIKIRHLKPCIKKEGLKYINLNCPVEEIPPATGYLRTIQLADLKLLQIFDNICKKNNLEYWLDFGNLLGAVRHKGFIPWDDDVDVSMLRDDYEKFISLYKDGIPEHEDLYITFNNNGKNKCFVKILHKKIPGIQIDIFPYDFYHRKTQKEERINLTNKILRHSNNIILNFLLPFYIHSPEKMRKRFIKFRNKKILENNIPNKSEKTDLFYGIDYPHIHKNHFFDYETIFPLKKIIFEGIEFSCPNKPEEILTQIWDDYMQLPDNCYPRHTNSSNIRQEIKNEMNKFIGIK